MVDAFIVFGFLFVAFAIAIKWADSKLKQSRNRITDDVYEIDRELALNAEIRRLQGDRRIGDDSTEYVKSTDSAGKGRTVPRGK
jgi:hypothetical protein